MIILYFLTYCDSGKSGEYIYIFDMPNWYGTLADKYFSNRTDNGLD